MPPKNILKASQTQQKNHRCRELKLRKLAAKIPPNVFAVKNAKSAKPCAKRVNRKRGRHPQKNHSQKP